MRCNVEKKRGKKRGRQTQALWNYRFIRSFLMSWHEKCFGSKSMCIKHIYTACIHRCAVMFQKIYAIFNLVFDRRRYSGCCVTSVPVFHRQELRYLFSFFTDNVKRSFLQLLQFIIELKFFFSIHKIELNVHKSKYVGKTKAFKGCPNCLTWLNGVDIWKLGMGDMDLTFFLNVLWYYRDNGKERVINSFLGDCAAVAACHNTHSPRKANNDLEKRIYL